MPKAKKAVAVFRGGRMEKMRAAMLAARARKGPICAACALSPDVLGLVAEMRAMIPATSFNAICKGLSGEGVQINRHTLERHVRDGHTRDARAKA